MLFIFGMTAFIFITDVRRKLFRPTSSHYGYFVKAYHLKGFSQKFLPESNRIGRRYGACMIAVALRDEGSAVVAVCTLRINFSGTPASMQDSIAICTMVLAYIRLLFSIA